MTTLIDVVNFNSDASCLSTRRWFEILSGGDDSPLVQWLKLYLRLGKPVSIGFPGATVADIALHNPEAIALINAHPEIFEIVARPFTHDIALLRLPDGFLCNLRFGLKTAAREFLRTTPFFLPPEFMLTNEQLTLLQREGVEGVFLNPSRFSLETRSRIPHHPYRVQGLAGASLDCIPFTGELTEHYLHALHHFDCTGWNRRLLTGEPHLFSWRDGESSFLLPDGLAREAYWLEHEDSGVNRSFVAQIKREQPEWPQPLDHEFRSYPVHSFAAWIKEFRMLGFLSRISSVESLLADGDDKLVPLWLQVINSDILSSVEKSSPVIRLRDTPEKELFYEHTLYRCERGFEGEEYLMLLEQALSGVLSDELPLDPSLPLHLRKWQGRRRYLQQLASRHAPSGPGPERGAYVG